MLSDLNVEHYITEGHKPTSKLYLKLVTFFLELIDAMQKFDLGFPLN
jgi:hypothetical protein